MLGLPTPPTPPTRDRPADLWAWPGAEDPAAGRALTIEVPMQTLDEMLSRKLLTPLQHAEIGAWIAEARTPEAIQQMPEPLWRSLTLASVLMNLDADLTQPPLLSAGA